ncbi:unnamed protein product [Adineta steineri]|uniref:Bromo domain-containing protein n=1 Tax=Adineta steineri TaxID=433720 RepID=A0A815R2I3_9BILA|nr:unnamed protein product [Adineta steineri]CAF1635987.1 unnamed protein product [Adineta steineri]
MFRRGINKRPRFSFGGHPVFETDDSSNHSGLGLALGVGDYEEDSSSQHHITSANSSDPNFLHGQSASDRRRRVQKAPTKPPQDDNTNLNACIDHLLRILSRKDKEGFFQYPVTDQFAPGYSQIILRPMDFSTMRKKMVQDEYANVLEFRSDFELMCENAMKYNRPDTIYWQAAKKLLATGSKLMHKDKLISFRRSVECFSRLTERELGFRIDSSNHAIDEQITNSNDQFDSSLNDPENLSSMSVSQACSQRKPKLILKLPKFYDKTPTTSITNEVVVVEEEDEEFSPEEILLQARQAAQCAHEKLNLRHSICSYTLAYQRVNNTTSLRFVNQDNFSQQTITLGEINNLPSNENLSSTLPIVNESEKRDNLTTKYSFENGPFSSNPSQNDSAFSSISKEELDLLIHTYGSEFSAQYAVSLMDYVKDAGDLALAYVDRFLSVLTNGEHDNFIMKRREKQVKEEEVDNKTIATTTATPVLSNDSTSIQIKIEPSINNNHDSPQQQFDIKPDDSSKLIMQLRQTPSNQLHQVISPPQQTNDFDITDKVLFNLSDITQVSNGPGQIISSEAIHHNLGIINNNESTFDTL